MKELRNNVDEIAFTDLQDAKKYYLNDENKVCSEEDYLGDDYEGYCRNFSDYQSEINESKNS